MLCMKKPLFPQLSCRGFRQIQLGKPSQSLSVQDISWIFQLVVFSLLLHQWSTLIYFYIISLFLRLLFHRLWLCWLLSFLLSCRFWFFRFLFLRIFLFIFLWLLLFGIFFRIFLFFCILRVLFFWFFFLWLLFFYCFWILLFRFFFFCVFRIFFFRFRRFFWIWWFLWILLLWVFFLCFLFLRLLFFCRGWRGCWSCFRGHYQFYFNYSKGLMLLNSRMHTL